MSSFEMLIKIDQQTFYLGLIENARFSDAIPYHDFITFSTFSLTVVPIIASKWRRNFPRYISYQMILISWL